MNLAIDLFCGLGGWTEGFLAEDYQVIGFDIERHDYGTGGYPGQLVLQDVTTLHGAQFRNATVIVASPPCQAYSYRAMPWSRAKALPPPDNTLFESCFRIQREANWAVCDCACWRCKTSHCVRCNSYTNTGVYPRYIPLVVENVRGAQKWVGQAKWHFGSYYLWGDVPALMPITIPCHKNGAGGSWFALDGNYNWGEANDPRRQKSNPGTHERTTGPGRPRFIREEVKVPGITFSGYGEPDYKPKGFNVTAAQRYREGVKNGKDWFGSGENCSLQRKASSKSDSRKAASAQIAKIPFPLAQHIARVFRSEWGASPDDRKGQ